MVNVIVQYVKEHLADLNSSDIQTAHLILVSNMDTTENLKNTMPRHMAVTTIVDSSESLQLALFRPV